jgi:hypothetical protein
MLNRHVYCALALLALGCSSTSDDPLDPGDARADQITPLDARADQTLDSAKLDAPLDAPPADADAARETDAARDGEGGPACQSVAIGRATDRGFTMRESGGRPSLDAGGCGQLDITTVCDFAAKTITTRGCRPSLPSVDQTYRLSDSEIAQIRVELMSFQTTCELTCPTDLPVYEISVNADSGGVRRYQSSTETGCPPFASGEFWAFRTKLETILNTCTVDRGLGGDAGPDEAGPHGDAASNDARVDGDASCPVRERVYPSNAGDAATDATDAGDTATDANDAGDAAADAPTDATRDSGSEAAPPDAATGD